MKRKNPTISKNLDLLVGKEIYLRINYPSSLGFISLVGKLKKTSIYYLEILGKTYADLIFIPEDVIKINKNNIDLKFNLNKDLIISLPIEREKNIVNSVIKTLINKKVRMTLVNIGNLIIRGTLKFNKKENIYYIQNSNLSIFVKFIEEAISYAFLNGDIRIKL